jgi:hypothetical protein
MQAIQYLRVFPVCPTNGLGQGVILRKDADDVDMVGHQAVTQDLKAILESMLSQQGEVKLAILIREEDILTVVTALGDVMGEAGNGVPRAPGHGSTLPET